MIENIGFRNMNALSTIRQSLLQSSLASPATFRKQRGGSQRERGELSAFFKKSKHFRCAKQGYQTQDVARDVNIIRINIYLQIENLYLFQSCLVGFVHKLP